MNKALFVTAFAAYVFGAASYLIAFIGLRWSGFDWLVSNAGEGLRRALIWPYLFYEWLRFDVPLI